MIKKNCNNLIVMWKENECKLLVVIFLNAEKKRKQKGQIMMLPPLCFTVCHQLKHTVFVCFCGLGEDEIQILAENL